MALLPTFAGGTGIVPHDLLRFDLDFLREASTYSSHGLRAFAAMFPLQFPRSSSIDSRSRRMLPFLKGTTQIEQHMATEDVIVLKKPA